MKIYTRTGDDGTTGLFGGKRVMKVDPRVEAYGTVDEINAVLGVARSCAPDSQLCASLERIQHRLFVMGAELATAPGQHEKLKLDLLAEDDVLWLEQQIDELEQALPALRQFILPAGCPLAAHLHHARTVCRRAERRVLSLGTERGVLVQFLNRLSDFLFVAARTANHERNLADVPWKP